MNQGTTAAKPQPSNQPQMTAPSQSQMPQVGNNVQQPQMPYGGFSGQQQQQQHRASFTGMNNNMQMGVGNSGFMHQQGQAGLPNPNQQGHRNSLPPMNNMGHQYPNHQGGFNPNFNQQGMAQSAAQQQHQQQQTMQQQFHQMAQQHGYQNPMQRQNSGAYPNPAIANGQQNNANYVRQASSNSRTGPPSAPNSQGPPLNFNAAPPGNSNPTSSNPAVNTSSGGGGGGQVPPGSGQQQPGPGGEYGQQFLPSGLNGDWQSDNDMHHRREMIQHM